MTLKKTTWLLIVGLALWACGGSDGGSTTDTADPDTIAEVSPDGTPEETTPDTPEEATPDVAEPTPDVTEEATEVTEETAEVAEETTEVAEEIDVTDPESEFSKLVALVETADYVNTTLPKVVAAADVMAAGLDTYVILDVRMKDRYGPDGSGVWQKVANGTPDFDDGHLEGAINLAWNDVVAYAEANLSPDDKILVVCYTGQDAGHSVLALNLLGYDASSLKWGMSGWNGVFDLWSSATGDTWADQFTTDPDAGKNASGDYPALATGKDAPEDILRDRVDALFAEPAPRLIDATTVLAAPEDFYIVNYWPADEYLNPGHLVGSHQYSPKASLKTTADLATLPIDQKIAVYCYSGQQSSQIAAFLTVLGYDAYSVKFGTNGMIYSQMTKQQWTGPGDYAFVGAPVVQPTEFSKLIALVETADYMNTAFPKVVAAADVMAAGLDTYVILDVRTKDKYGPDTNGDWQMVANGTPDFADGHLEGAINVAWNDAVAYAEANLSKDDKILVACYTGQDAGHAVLALNLLGYDAYSLKWGMSGWNGDFDLWSSATGDTWDGQFTTDADPGKGPAGAYPTLETGEATAEDILRARIDALEGTGTTRIIDASAVFAAPEDFYVVNYWSEADYLAPGHIAGAHQYTPKASLKTTADLATLPIDQKIAVYCYTGQQSSQVAAFLTVLGYDAYSIKFGTNGMIYSQMTAQKWTLPGDYAYVQ